MVAEANTTQIDRPFAWDDAFETWRVALPGPPPLKLELYDGVEGEGYDVTLIVARDWWDDRAWMDVARLPNRSVSRTKRTRS